MNYLIHNLNHLLMYDIRQILNILFSLKNLYLNLLLDNYIVFRHYHNLQMILIYNLYLILLSKIKLFYLLIDVPFLSVSM